MRQNVTLCFPFLCAVQDYQQFSSTLATLSLITKYVCRQAQQSHLRETEECM